MSASSPRSRPAAWKVLVALLSVSLSLLLWLGGLIESLQRPSVGGDLALLQLELALLAEPALPPPLKAVLLGSDPRAALLKEMTSQEQGADQAISPAQRLQRALLFELAHQPAEAHADLQSLRERPPGSLPEEEQQLLELLLAADSRGIQAVAPRLPTPTLRLLACERGGGSPRDCQEPAVARQAATQLVLVNGLPGLALLLGLILLIRELWLLGRGRLLPSPPLVGPDLTLVDLALLVAGGFVVIGNLTPLVVTPLLQSLLASVTWPDTLRQGLSYPVLYLSMTVAPLLILALMLRGLGSPPAGGWLQFRWMPPLGALRLGLTGLLIVLPLVSFTGWLVERILPSPSGSNPMLELVLHSQDRLALACFALTALVLAPLFEEVIFRGVLLPVLARDFGIGPGLILSSAVFALAHLSVSETPSLFVLGLGLARLRQRSGRLSASVFMHGLWNGFTFLNLVLLGG
ncbi:MAG: lysostaphin resistance A-like protein [Cyanobacteriota bacterium]